MAIYRMGPSATPGRYYQSRDGKQFGVRVHNQFFVISFDDEGKNPIFSAGISLPGKFDPVKLHEINIGVSDA